MMGGMVAWALIGAVYTHVLYPEGKLLESFSFPVDGERVVTLTWSPLDSVPGTPPDSVFISTEDTVIWKPPTVLEWLQTDDRLVVTVYPWSDFYRYTAIQITYTTEPASPPFPKVPLETFLQMAQLPVNVPPENLQGPPDLVLVTPPFLLGAAKDYVSAHLFTGHYTVIYTTDWIDSRPGSTRPERIRNLFREILNRWGRFSAFLVGPASELPGFPTWVPYRGNPAQDQFPTDYFYGALMSDVLDRDGDGFLGEKEDSMDLSVQIPVGRLVVSDSAAFARYREKMWDWWTNPPNVNSILKNVAEFPRNAYTGQTYVNYALQNLAALMDTTTLYEDSDSILNITLDLFRDSMTAPHRAVVSLFDGFFNKFWINTTPVIEFWRMDGAFFDTTSARFLWFPFVCDAGAYDQSGLIPDYVNRRGGPVGAWATGRLNFPQMSQYFYRWLFDRLAQKTTMGDAARWTLNNAAPYGGTLFARYHLLGFVLHGDPLLPLWIGPVSPPKIDPAYVVQGSQVEVDVWFSFSGGDSGTVVVWRPATGEYHRTFVVGEGTLIFTFDRIGEPDTLWVSGVGKSSPLFVNFVVLPQDNSPYLADHWVEYTAAGGIYVHTRVVDPDGQGTFTVYPAEGTWSPSSVTLTDLTTDTVITWRYQDGPLPAFYTFVVDQKSWKIWVGEPEAEPERRLWTAQHRDTLEWVYDLGSFGTYRLQLTGANGGLTRTGTLLEGTAYRFLLPYEPRSGETLQVRIDRYISFLRTWTRVLEDTLVWQSPPLPPGPGGFVAIPGGVRVLGITPDGVRGLRIAGSSGVGFLFDGTLPAQVGLNGPESLWLYTLDSARILSAPVFAGLAVPGPAKLWEVDLGNVQPLWAPVALSDTTVLVWDDGGHLHAITHGGKERSGFPLAVSGVPVRDPVVWQRGETLLVAWPLNADLFVLKAWPGGITYGPSGLPGHVRVVGLPTDSGVTVFAMAGDGRVFQYKGNWTVVDTLPTGLLASPAVWNDTDGPVLVLPLSGVGLVRWDGEITDTLFTGGVDFVAAGDVDTQRAGEEIVWRVGDTLSDTLYVGGRNGNGMFEILHTWYGVGLPDKVVGILEGPDLWLWNISTLVRVNLLTGGREVTDFTGTATLIRAEGVIAGDGVILPTAGNRTMGVDVDGFPLEMGEIQHTPFVLGNLLVAALGDGRVVGLKLLPTDTSSTWFTGNHDVYRSRNLSTANPALVWPEAVSGVATSGTRVLPVLRLPGLMRAGQVLLVNPVEVPLSLRIYNALGRRVQTVELEPLGTRPLRLTVPGVYFVQVHPEGQVRVRRKLVVIR